MVIAQALGEYGVVSAFSVVVDALTRTWRSASQYLSDVDPMTWLILGIGVFLVMYARNLFR